MSDLTKWPRLIVVPERGHETVAREQANEILLRTNSPWFSCNDRGWVRCVADALGIEVSDRGGYPDVTFAAQEEWRKSVGALNLRYCYNSQIMSAWIGGPHGWCDWGGGIGCSTWNIGKWPEAEEVTADWEKVAAAFPYPDLHVQCVADEGEGKTAAQWRVTGGKAALVEPIERFRPQEVGEMQMITRLVSPYGERGVTLERLREAARQLRAAL